jgi:hypothetical protein
VKRRIRVVVELGCLQCGRDIGNFETEIWPSCGPFVLKRKGRPAARIADWHVVRCEVCGGNAMPVEVTAKPIPDEVLIDWNADRPRVGRPPKRIVEARRAGSE